MLLLDSLLRFLAGCLMIGMPIGLAVWLKRRLPSTWRWFGVGAATFVVSQILHIPFNIFVLTPLLQWLGLDIGNNRGIQLALACLLLGLSAGLFEEYSRFVVYRYYVMASWNGQPRASFKTAVMLGSGHGGCESILVGFAALVALVQMIVLQHYSDDLGKIGIPADKIEQIQEALSNYWSIPWYGVLLAPLERVYAILFHLSASILVWQAVLSRKYLWFGAAVLYHTALDGIAVFVLQTWNAYMVEVVLGVTSLPLSLYILRYFRDSSDPREAVEFLPVLQDESDEENVDGERDNEEFEHDIPSVT